jgi:hypothetical protein
LPLLSQLLSDIVAKVENRTTPKISQMLIFANSATAVFRSANTKLRDRFCAKRCGPSYRRARNASAVLKNFGRHPKKTFATISSLSRQGSSMRMSASRQYRTKFRFAAI